MGVEYEFEFLDTEQEWRGDDDLYVNGLPVPDEEFIRNLRINLKRNLPNIKREEEHDRIMVMICGGPTAKNFLDDIRMKSLDSKYDVFCSNKTHDWLLQNGIKPYAQFVIDPKKSKVHDVENPQKGIKYMIGAQCVPEVFDKLQEFDLYRIACPSGVKTKSGIPDYVVISSVLEEGTYDFVVGGTMAGLRAMTLGELLGYRTIEFYGFDSCFFDYGPDGTGQFYSYHKPRGDDIIEVQTRDGRTWLTSPVFASQAKQYIKWKHRLGWVDFKIYGDNLTATLDKQDEEDNARKHDRLFSDLHIALNRNLHEEKKFKGIGRIFAGDVALLAGQMVKKHGRQTLLDYGCGSQELVKRLPPIENLEIHLYDPAIPEFSQKPVPADIVVCTDVLEHVEPDCLENVLDHLQALTKKLLYVSVCTVMSSLNYSTGQNVHTIVQPQEWWMGKLKRRFVVAEGPSKSAVPGRFMCVLANKTYAMECGRITYLGGGA